MNPLDLPTRDLSDRRTFSKNQIKAFPSGAIPPQNGGNVGNAVSIERQKGARRAQAELSADTVKWLMTEEDKKTIDMKTTILILSRLLLVSLVKSTSPMRRTHPLCQPKADISPNSMGEFTPRGKLVIWLRLGAALRAWILRKPNK